MDLKPIEALRALVKLGMTFEQAYGQCWRDLIEQEKQKKPTQPINEMTEKSAQAKINASKRWKKGKKVRGRPN